MPGKSTTTAYSDFRLLAEWQPKSKLRLKVQMVPSLAAYLLMLGRRYQRTAEIIEHKRITGGVPGMKEAAQRMRYAVEHIQWILDQLPQNFDRQDWRDAVAEVCKLLNIQTGDAPIYDIPADKFGQLVKVPTDGSDEDTVGSPVQSRLGSGAGSEDKGGDVLPGRSGGTGAEGVGERTKGRGRNVPDRKRRGGSGDKSN